MMYPKEASREPENQWLVEENNPPGAIVRVHVKSREGIMLQGRPGWSVDRVVHRPTIGWSWYVYAVYVFRWPAHPTCGWCVGKTLKIPKSQNPTTPPRVKHILFHRVMYTEFMFVI